MGWVDRKDWEAKLRDDLSYSVTSTTADRWWKEEKAMQGSFCSFSLYLSFLFIEKLYTCSFLLFKSTHGLFCSIFFDIL